MSGQKPGASGVRPCLRFSCQDKNRGSGRIDPFFKALGWDVDNEQGYAEAYSGLFHFSQEQHRTEPPDEWTLSLAIDDRVLKDIIRKLYYPESPYEFSVLAPPDPRRNCKPKAFSTIHGQIVNDSNATLGCLNRAFRTIRLMQRPS